MRLRFALPLLLLAGCSPGPVSAAGDCTLAAQVDGETYVPSGTASADRVGARYTQTVRQRGCDDVIEFGQPAPEAWRNGDSSFAPNTPLFASLDHPTSEVLLVEHPAGRWLELSRLPRQ